MNLSADNQVLLLLCSRLGISQYLKVEPLSLKEWQSFARKLTENGIVPGELLEMKVTDIASETGLSDEGAERLSLLLGRGALLAMELETLSNLGIKIVTLLDPEYPIRLTERLKRSAPAILFIAGDKELIGQPGVAVVGSRNVSEIARASAEFIGNLCGVSGLVLYSGGARGVDTLAMDAALQARGSAVGILADSLNKAIQYPENRRAILRGDLCLASPYSPDAPFNVGMAMARNKMIYALADYAVVVTSEAEKGGTWAGATEAIKANWTPVFVLDHADLSEGNRQLIKRGGKPFPFPPVEDDFDLRDWLASHSEPSGHDEQMQLF